MQIQSFRALLMLLIATSVGCTNLKLFMRSVDENASTGINQAPVHLAAPLDRIYPLDPSNTSPPILQNQLSAYAFTSSFVDPDGDTLTYTCAYRSMGLAVTDPNYAAAGSNCNTLPSLVTVSGIVQLGNASMSGATLNWWPTNTQKGAFEFSVTASDGTLSTSNSFLITVREEYSTTNLLLSLDAGVTPRLLGGDRSNWNSVIGSLFGILTTFTSPTPWIGTGIWNNPYALAFSGVANDKINLGTIMSAQAEVGFSMWLNPTTPTAANSVLLGDADAASTSGFVVKQASDGSGKVDFLVPHKTYSEVILADSPVTYYRMNTSSGVALQDLSTQGHDGTLVNSPTLGANGALARVDDSDNAITFNGTNQYGVVPDHTDYHGTQVTLEAWIKTSYLGPDYPGIILKRNTSGGAENNHGFFLYMGDPTFTSSTDIRLMTSVSGSNGSITSTSQVKINDNAWHHIAMTYDDVTISVYVDGKFETSALFTSGGITSPYPWYIGTEVPALGLSRYFPGSIDEVAIYDHALTSDQLKNHYLAGVGKYQSTILAASPSGFWRLGDSNIDLTRHEHHATATGTLTTGLSGPLVTNDSKSTSVLLNNVTSNDLIEIPDTEDYTASFSTGLWLRSNGISSWTAPYGVIGKQGTFLIQTGYPGSNPKNLQVYIHAGGGSFQSASPLPLPLDFSIQDWHYYFITFDGVTLRYYIDGKLAGSVVASIFPTVNANSIRIGNVGAWAVPNQNIPAYIADVEMYKRALPAAEILAHYQAHATVCRSKSPLMESWWNQLAGTFDGTLLNLVVNGNHECEVSPSNPVFTPATNTYVGGTATGVNPFNGAISDLKIFSSTSISNLKSIFSNAADLYRNTPRTPASVTDALVFQFDPRNARQGLRPYAAGCASTDLLFNDLSSSAARGVMNNFLSADCSGAPADGWQGIGSVANPYTLNFDGADDFIEISNQSSLQVSTGFTFDVWIKLTNTATPHYIFSKFDSSNEGYTLYVDAAGRPRVELSADGITYNTFASSSTITAGNWTHLSATGDGTNVRFYINGSLVPIDAGIGSGDGLFSVSIFASTASLFIGKTNFGAPSYFIGSLGNASIYSRALSNSEVTRNCRATASIYGVTCN